MLRRINIRLGFVLKARTTTVGLNSLEITLYSTVETPLRVLTSIGFVWNLSHEHSV